jgi:hypothetical protein
MGLWLCGTTVRTRAEKRSAGGVLRLGIPDLLSGPARSGYSMTSV